MGFIKGLLMYFIYLLPIFVIMIIIDKIDSKVHIIEKMNDTVKAIVGLLSCLFALCSIIVPFLAFEGNYNTYLMFIIPCAFGYWFFDKFEHM